MAAALEQGTGFDVRWGRIAAVAGYVTAAGLVIGTVLFLLDATDVLANSPTFHKTAAGFDADRARFYAAIFNHQHQLVWDIAIRDTVGPLAFVALMVLGIATAQRVAWRHPGAALMSLFFVVGGLLIILNDLIYMSQLQLWKYGGWAARPPGRINELGAASETIENVTNYLEASGYVVIGAGLICLALLCRSQTELPRWLGAVAYVLAAGMAVLAVGLVASLDVLFQIGGAVAGILVGPLVVIVLGRHLHQSAAHEVDPPITA